MKSKSGFTLVELMVVLVAIAILVTITVVSYRGVSAEAMDSRIKTIVNDVGEALQIADLRYGTRPAAQGYFANANGIDSFVVPTYLPAGYRDGVTSSNTSNGSQAFRYYRCGSGRDFIIYASLNRPTSQEVSSFQAAKATCGHTTQAPETGSISYNYARIFRP